MNRRSLLALPALGILAACASVPDLPLAERPADLASSTSSIGVPEGDWPNERWWDRYGDPQLGALIDEALSNSPSLAAAAARVRRADALARQSEAALQPNLSGDASLTGAKQSQNNGPPPQFVPDGVRSNTRIAASASWDPDLWGRNRDALAAARGEAVAARADAAEARRVLTAAIASAYADLARALADRDNALAVADIRKRSFELTRARVANGLDTPAAAQQSLAVDRASRSDVLAIDEQIALTRARLAALIGAGPDRGQSITQPTLGSVPNQLVPEGLGIDVVARRPDIAAALMRIEAASARVKGARKDFLPNVSLSGLLGLQSLDIGKIASTGSDIYSFGLAVHLPIFDGGRLEAAYRSQSADYDLAVSNYNQALVGALQEIASAVATGRTLDERISQLTEAAAAAERAHDVAVARYERGLTSYLNVLSAEDTLVATRRALLAVRYRRISADIDLTRALGGGYRREAPSEVSRP